MKLTVSFFQIDGFNKQEMESEDGGMETKSSSTEVRK